MSILSSNISTCPAFVYNFPLGSCSANHDKTPNVFGKRGKPENAENREEIKQIKIPRLQAPEDVSRIKAEPMVNEAVKFSAKQ